MKITCTKLYQDFPFAHRQPAHSGHCAFIHGHNWGFEFTFSGNVVHPETGFVIDFGEMKWLKAYLTKMFDHTLLLNETDPELRYLQNCLSPLRDGNTLQLADIRIVPDCSSEGIARMVLDHVNNDLLPKCLSVEAYVVREVRLTRVRVFEDSKNSATVEV